MEVYEAQLALMILGYISNGFFFFAHTPSMIRTIKNRSVGDTSAIPYLATLGSCLVWFLYGLPFWHPHGTLVLAANGIGITIMAVIITVHFWFCQEPKQRLWIIVVLGVEVVCLAILATTTLTLIEDPGFRRAVFGIACSTCNVVLYISPISILVKVVRTMSVEHMSLLVALAMFANAAIWGILALLPLDPVLFISFAVCALLALVQLVVYAIVYYRST